MQFDMVFEGGGAKGMAFVGAYHAFTTASHTPGRVLGTSAGSITATALAAGYTAEEMALALGEQVGGRPVFTTFLGDPAPFSADELEAGSMRKLLEAVDLPLVPEGLEDRLDARILRAMAENPRLRNLLSFIERGGWYSADAFITWMRERLNRGTDGGKPRAYGDMTLAEFFKATERDLTLVAADTSDGRMLVLNRLTTPDCPVVYAARMSMSVPLLWEEVVWQPEWGSYRGRDLAGHTVVDGGLLSNFPIALLISGDPQVTAVMGEKRASQVIGFLIDETLPVPTAPPPPPGRDLSAVAGFATIQRLKRLVDAATQAHDRAAIDAFEHLVVRLPAKTYGTTEFDMSPERRDAIVRAGHDVTRDYLAARQSAPPGVGAPGPASMDDLAREKALDILEQ